MNLLQSSLVNQAAASPGHALTYAYKRKMQTSGESCHRAGIVFIPLPVETLGSWHETAVQQIEKLGAALGR